VKNGSLLHFSGLNEQFGTVFREPCIVFAGHPSLRCGDVIHFIKQWGSNSKNALILTGKKDVKCGRVIFADLCL